MKRVERNSHHRRRQPTAKERRLSLSRTMQRLGDLIGKPREELSEEDLATAYILAGEILNCGDAEVAQSFRKMLRTAAERIDADRERVDSPEPE